MADSKDTEDQDNLNEENAQQECKTGTDEDNPSEVATLKIIEEYNEMFKNRYTEEDEDYKKTISKPIPPPPCVKNWSSKQHYNRNRRGQGYRGNYHNRGGGGYRGNYGNQGPSYNKYQRQDRGGYSGYDNRHQGSGYGYQDRNYDRNYQGQPRRGYY